MMFMFFCPLFSFIYLLHCASLPLYIIWVACLQLHACLLHSCLFSWVAVLFKSLCILVLHLVHCIKFGTWLFHFVSAFIDASTFALVHHVACSQHSLDLVWVFLALNFFLSGHHGLEFLTCSTLAMSLISTWTCLGLLTWIYLELACFTELLLCLDLLGHLFGSAHYCLLLVELSCFCCIVNFGVGCRSWMHIWFWGSCMYFVKVSVVFPVCFRNNYSYIPTFSPLIPFEINWKQVKNLVLNLYHVSKINQTWVVLECYLWPL